MIPKLGIGSGSNLYITWNDDTAGVLDVKIARSSSTSIGQDFVDAAFSTTNLSNSAGTISDQPELSTFADNVFVVWRERTSDDDKDIRSVTSIDNGAAFTTPRDLSALTNGNPGFLSTLPKISASGNNAFVVWQENDNAGGGLPDIKYVTIGATAPLTFLASNHRLSETATIRITDSDLNTNAGSQDEFNVSVKSSTDSVTGITVTLKETTNTSGIFEGTLTFSSSSSTGTVLKASAGDTITATFGTSSGTTTIYSRTVAFVDTSNEVGNIVRVIVTDENSNIDNGNSESVTVSLSARDSGDTASITLQETGDNTGIFGTNSDHNIIIMKNDLSIPIGRTLTITETVPGNSADVNNPDTRQLTISSPTSAGNLLLNNVETGDNTNQFTIQLTVSAAATGGSNIQVATCDILLIVNPAGVNERGLITPCSDSDKVALIVDVPTTTDSDQITASYSGAEDSNIIFYDNTKGGGGGGGLVRATVVLNAILGVSAFGGEGGGDRSPPISTLDIISLSKSIDVPDHIRAIIKNQEINVPIEPLENESFDLPLLINEKGFPLGSTENTIVTQNINVGEPIKFQILFYEKSDLEHVSIYMNLRDGIGDDQSDTYILFYKDEPLKIVDKNGFFENVEFEIIEGEDNKKFAVFEIKFAKPMETSDLIYKSWDFKKRGLTVTVYDAINVQGLPSENEVIGETIQEIVNETPIEKQPVPVWVKSNAKWWAEGELNDETFTNGIAFLIQQEIINLPTEENVSLSVDEKEESKFDWTEEKVEVKVPEWIKSNALWWANDQIDEETFLSGIEYLVKNGIITV